MYRLGSRNGYIWLWLRFSSSLYDQLNCLFQGYNRYNWKHWTNGVTGFCGGESSEVYLTMYCLYEYGRCEHCLRGEWLTKSIQILSQNYRIEIYSYFRRWYQINLNHTN